MHAIPGFKITKIVEENTFSIYEAIRSKDELPVIIKSAFLKDVKQVKQLDHEFELASNLDPSCTLKPISLERTFDTEALVYEEFKGQTLYQYLKGGPLSLREFFKIAIPISKGLFVLHEKGIIHKDIKPQNIFINPANDEIRIIDFGIASLLPTEYSPALPNPEFIEGTLPYMSPEQTGRMNRALDYRTDMYSLGVAFYLMITGELPFKVQDPLELVYSHMVRIPKSPSEISPFIPQIISDIITKLMSKLAEDRYQSMEGLKHDLERCLEQLEKAHEVLPFTLGEKDFSGKLHISQKIYGREKEINSLLDSYEEMVKTGTPQLIFVSGYSGIGKTALVNELHKPIVRGKGFFISGKFDQYKRDIPYSTIVEAFKELVSIILSESEEKIKEWKEKILEAVGINGQIIIDIIPQLEIVTGKQPAVIELAPTESGNRFNMTFEKFTGIFSQRQHPLSIFLDDLQWADGGSLQLIQQIVTNPVNKYILLIGAYRDNEVYAAHPLMLTLDNIKKAHVPVKDIVLSPLKEEDITSLVSDSLKSDRERVGPLSLLAYEKTRGNPFFTIQFLLSLYQENLLIFDHKSNQWQWKLEYINEKGYTDNVVDLMAGKIRRLSPQTQELLKLAACIGNKFDRKTLSLISSETEEEMTRKLNEPIREGLIFSYDHAYKFLHDRLQEAAYSLIPETNRAEIHLRIGRLLASGKTEMLLEEGIFELVNQFNRGISLITDPGERIFLCRLNFRAGRRAKAATAYASARNYLAEATTLLPGDAWSSHYEDTFALTLELSECEYLSGRFERAQELFTLILGKAESNPDRAQVYRLHSKLLQVSGRYQDALAVGLECLALFGVTCPDSDEQFAAALSTETREFHANLRGRRIAELAEAPVATDPDARSVIGMIAELAAPMYITKSRLFSLLILKGINVSLRSGNTEESCSVYAFHAILLAGLFDDTATAFEFLEMSLHLNDKFNDAKLKGKLNLLRGSSIFFWRKHIAGAVPLLEGALIDLLNIGDFAYAGYTIHSLVWTLIETGLPIDEILAVARKKTAILAETRNETIVELVRQMRQFLACLKGKTRGVTSFEDDTFNEAESLAIFAKGQFLSGYTYHYIMKQIAAFLFERIDEALDYSKLAEEKLTEAMSTPVGAIQPFFHALTLAAAYPKVPADQQREFAETLNGLLRKLKRWADNCPENFLNRYALVSAEVARIEGRDMEAMRLYEEAIKSARENHFIQNEGIAYEVASRFYREKGFEIFANTYLVKARDRYFRWGAGGKVKQLEENHPFLKVHKPRSASATVEGLPIEQLDVLSIIKASQTISGQFDFEQLAGNLMKIVIQQAGAEKAYLLLNKDDQLVLVAEAKNIQDTISIKTHTVTQQPEADSLAKSIVQYVKSSKEKIILDDASLPNMFSSDNYILTAHPKSIACLPIIKQAKLIGILYLENNLFTGAFSPDKILILELLASQAAISIENSILFTDLTNSRQLLQDTMDNSSAVIFLKDLNGKYLFVNREYENIFGLSREKIVGRTAYDLPKEIADMTTAHDREVFETGKPIVYEESGPHQDGLIHTHISVRFPVYDLTGKIYAIGGVSTDISDRKRAEEALREREARIRRLVDSNIIGIFFWDVAGQITEANDAFFKIVGYSLQDLKLGNLSWKKITPADYIAADQKALRELERAGTCTPYEKEYIRKDGSLIPVLVGGAILQGSKDKGVAFVLDLRDLKSAGAEILRLNLGLQQRIKALNVSQEELKRVNSELLKTNIDLDNFIYAASHNVRGPVASLEGLINILDLKLYEQDELSSILSKMKLSISRFNQTINDLTELSKVQKIIESKDVALFNIEKIVENIKAELEENLEASGALIKTDFHEVPSINFSETNFRRILSNLIVNAISYRSPTRKPEIFIKSTQTQEYVILSIKDNGLGINERNKEKIFLMFTRAHSHVEGRGIGLYIVKRIIENAGGKIEFESEVDEGSTFRVFLKK
ncbi:MAG TPA: AAA family ATPase [Cytophagaceae bacterium]|jgi:PAS domain S-box-containing protein|nr:AAA family ATPase [Cytophagaceae bacterium]